MRYQILYRRGPDGEFGKLVPGEHLGIYDRPEVNAEIDHMAANPHIVGIAVLLDIDLFNIMRVPDGTICLTAFTR